jgi:hypothetical protein
MNLSRLRKQGRQRREKTCDSKVGENRRHNFRSSQQILFEGLYGEFFDQTRRFSQRIRKAYQQGKQRRMGEKGAVKAEKENLLTASLYL